MSKRTFLTCAMAILLCGTATAAADETDVFVTGQTSVGGHYIEAQDEIGRVGEYVSTPDVEDVLPHLKLDLAGGTANTLFDILLLYKDEATKSFGLDLRSDSWFSAGASYRSFQHNLDHDLLQNLQAREQVPDAANPGEFKPGGKQVYHTDNDPLGRYFVQYQRFEGEMEARVPWVDHGRAYSRYTDQRKQGWKQVTAIDHCAFCHISGDRRQVNEQVKTWRAGAEGGVGAVTANYEFAATDYYDHTRAPTHTWLPAAHPVLGTVGLNGTNPDFPYGVEFGSRLNFSDVTLPYAQATTSEKRSHEVGLKADLPKGHQLRGSFTHTESRSWTTGLEGDFDAYAASWVTRPTAKSRISARFLSYETKVDDYFVDLPLYRLGRTGGGQDFDWTRISAANRDVLQTDLAAGYRLSKSGWLRLGWRHRTVDRDAMAQTQTSYVNEDGTNVLVPSTAVPNETTTDRFKLSLNQRFGRKGNGFLAYTYTTVDQQFMNPTAMCEEGLNGEDVTLAGNGSVYYFQRQRYGNGTGLPNQSHRITARGSYQLSARTSVSGYLTYASEKNDDLNVYEFERTVFAPGVNLWTAPSDRFLVTLGYGFSSVESNANLCPPIFDG